MNYAFENEEVEKLKKLKKLKKELKEELKEKVSAITTEINRLNDRLVQPPITTEINRLNDRLVQNIKNNHEFIQINNMQQQEQQEWLKRIKYLVNREEVSTFRKT